MGKPMNRKGTSPMDYRYELVNPSDLIGFDADNDETAMIVGYIVGNGFAAKATNGTFSPPLNITGSTVAVDAFCHARFAMSFTDTIATVPTADVARALATFVYNPDEFAKQGPLTPVEIEAWNDRCRTSAHNIVARAHEMAARYTTTVPA
jgi:hypothetical protein